VSLPLRGAGRRRAALALGAGLLLLALTWRVHPLATPPMYEGNGPIVSPYVYLHPPPGLGGTGRPLSRRQTLSVAQGESPAFALQTTEQPPQAQLIAQAGTFAVPAGTGSLVASATPVDAPPVPPLGGRLDGNVYDLEVSADGVPRPLRPGRRATVVLRSPAGVQNPTLELFADGRWTRLDTQPLGALSGDSYTADVSRLGDVALVAARGSTSGGNLGAVVVGAVAAVLLAGGVALTLLRPRRRPRPTPHRDPGRERVRPAPRGGPGRARPPERRGGRRRR